MNIADETVIPLSKSKIALLVAGSLLFVAIGVWMMGWSQTEIAMVMSFGSPLVMQLIGAASLLFFGFCGFIGVKKLFDKRPGLVLNAAGMMDNSSGISAGLIPWAEITSIEALQIEQQKLLVVKVQNPDKYVQLGGAMRQAANKMNMKLCGSPLVISANSLEMNFAELLEISNAYLAKHRAPR